MLSRPITVPRALLLHVWSLEELGDPHPVLGGSDLYVPADSAEEFTRECFDALAGLGLARDGILTRDFLATLRFIAAPDRELYCWSAHADRGQDRKFCVCAGGDEAVAMQVRGDVVSIVRVDERRLLDAFIDELPEFQAAPVPELTIARRDFEARDEPEDLFSSGPDPAKELNSQLRAPREAVHQLYAAKASGGRLRRSKPFSVIDVSEQGRILVFVDGQDNLHRLPGTPTNLAKTLVATWQAM